MKTDELVAGRELDALVAEKLKLPDGSYSQTIEAAWLVVNRLNALGYYVSVDQTQDGTAAVAILEHVDEECDSLVNRIVGADYVPLAICRAALEIVG